MGLKTSTEAYERVMYWREAREIDLWRRHWFVALVCSTVTAKYHRRSKNWMHLNTTGTERKKRGWRQKNVKGSWAGGLYQSSRSSVFLLLFLGNLPDIDLVPVVSQALEAKWKGSTQVREESENEFIHSRHKKWHQERMHLAKTLLWPCEVLHGK